MALCVGIGGREGTSDMASVSDAGGHMGSIDLVSGAGWPKGVQGLTVDSIRPHYSFLPSEEQMQAVTERQLHGALDVSVNNRSADAVGDALGLSKDLVEYHTWVFEYFAKDAGVDINVLDVDPKFFDITKLETAQARLDRAVAAANQASDDLAAAQARRWMEVVGHEQVIVGTQLDADGIEVPIYEQQPVYGMVGPDAAEVAAAQANLDRATSEFGAAQGEVNRLQGEMDATVAFNRDLLDRQNGMRDKIFVGLNEENPANKGIARLTFELFRANEGMRKFLNSKWMNEFQEKFKKIMNGETT